MKYQNIEVEKLEDYTFIAISKTTGQKQALSLDDIGRLLTFYFLSKDKNKPLKALGDTMNRGGVGQKVKGEKERKKLGPGEAGGRLSRGQGEKARTKKKGVDSPSFLAWIATPRT